MFHYVSRQVRTSLLRTAEISTPIFVSELSVAGSGHPPMAMMSSDGSFALFPEDHTNQNPRQSFTKTDNFTVFNLGSAHGEI